MLEFLAPIAFAVHAHTVSPAAVRPVEVTGRIVDLVRPLTQRPSRFTARVMAPPPCFDLKMAIDVSGFNSNTPVLGFEPETAQAWKGEVARCKGGSSDVRVVVLPKK